MPTDSPPGALAVQGGMPTDNNVAEGTPSSVVPRLKQGRENRRRLFLFCLGLTALGCGEIRRREILSKIEASSKSRAAVGGFVGELCAWDPPLYESYETHVSSLTLTGDETAGTGEVTAEIQLSPTYSCKGTASFHYEKRKHGSGATYYFLQNFTRIGAWPEIVNTVQTKAKPISLDAQVDLELSPGLTPDGRAAGAVKVEIPQSGTYCFHVSDPHSEVVFTAFQNGAPVRDHFGAITALKIDKGTVYMLVTSKDPRTTKVAVKSAGCK
ncbi:MAG: hypothetical protein U0165_11260 [Polyangiaceae bacterium]